jgi:hypothetical protein
MSFSLDKFDKKKAVCKSCNKNIYLQHKQVAIMDKIKERIPIRNALINMSKDEVGDTFDIDKFYRYFVPFETYEEMKKQHDNYSFCVCSHMRELDREHYKEQYEKKYFLDVVMCDNKLTRSGYIIRII